MAALLSLRSGLVFEDPRGHLMNALALALYVEVLALALKEKSWP